MTPTSPSISEEGLTDFVPSKADTVRDDGRRAGPAPGSAESSAPVSEWATGGFKPEAAASVESTDGELELLGARGGEAAKSAAVVADDDDAASYDPLLSPAKLPRADGSGASCVCGCMVNW